jgi:capsular polysaccharide biosynthesis protein
MVRLAAPLKPLFPYLKPGYSLGTSLVAPFTTLASMARGNYLPRGSVATLEEAAAASGGRSWIVRPAEVSSHPAPPGVRHPTFDAEATETIPRVALAELPGGRVLGQHAAVITGHSDLVREVSTYFGTTRPRQHPLYLHPFPREPVDVPGRVGVLAYQGGAVNYYHFVTDVLPRVGVVEQCTDVEPPDLWYVPASTPDRVDLLDRMGIPADRRIDSVAFPHIRAETLVVPGLPGTELHPAWVTGFLRDRLLREPYERIPGNHLYITRGTSKNNRAVTNDAQVVEALSARGFRSVDPGQLTLAEEIKTFAEADIIVSAHGAALTNIVFASPGSLLIELFPGRNVVPCYWKLAHTVPGLSYLPLFGIATDDRTDRTRTLVRDIEVDIPALLGLVDEHG